MAANYLREALDYAYDEQRRRDQEAQAAATSDNTIIGNAYRGARIGTDVNAAQADEASLRFAGRTAEADAKAQQIERLRAEQAKYDTGAPEFTDIRTPGDAWKWGMSSIGQAAASMQDPLALAAGANAVGAPLSKLGGVAGGIGKAIQWGGNLGAFGLNQRQMTGEMYGRLKDDPQAMQNLSPRDAYLLSNAVGVGGGALDTLVPAGLAKAFTGGALKKGLRGIEGNFALNTAKRMGQEGVTEGAQELLAQGGHSWANPERDRSGDVRDVINNAAAGAFGSGPMSAAGAAADRGYAGAGHAGGVVKNKAGEMVDTAREHLDPVYDAASDRVEQAYEAARDQAQGVAKATKDAYDAQGLRGVVDLGVDQGKSVWERAAEFGSRTKARGEQLRQAMADAKANYERSILPDEDRRLLTDAPPAELQGQELDDWVNDTSARRFEYVAGKLGDLEAQGVEEVSPLLDRLSSDDPVEQEQALQEASKYLLDRHRWAKVSRNAAAFAAMTGEFIGKSGPAVGRAAVSAASTVSAVGKAGKEFIDGARAGAQQAQAERKSKHNLQGAGQGESFNFDSWTRMQEQAGVSTTAMGHAIKRAKLGRARTERLRPMATSAGEVFAAEAAAQNDGTTGVDTGDYARSLAYELVGRADDFVQGHRSSTFAVDGLADDLYGLLGEQAGQLISRVAAASPPGERQYMEMVGQRVGSLVSRSQEQAQQQASLQDQVLALLPQAQQAELRQDGGAGARSMMEMLQALTRGRVTPGQRQALEQALGKDTLGRMLDVLNVDDEGRPVSGGEVVDDRSQAQGEVMDDLDEGMARVNDDGEYSNESFNTPFDKAQAEKAVEKDAGASTYNFARTKAQSGRTPSSRFPDPFAPTKSREKGGGMVRPKLFRLDVAENATDFAGTDGTDGLKAKLAEMRELHKDAGGGQRTVAKRLTQVADDLGLTTADKLKLFRDYLRQENLTDDAAKRAAYVDKVMSGAVTNPEGVARTLEAMKEFFNNRAVVVTEQGTQRVQLQMRHNEVVSMGKGGDDAVKGIRKQLLDAGLKATSEEFVKKRAEALSKANLLFFTSAEKNVMGRTSGAADVVIPADRLVKWVRSQKKTNEANDERLDAKDEKAKGKTSRDEKAKLYLEDLMDGITSVIASGYVDGKMPSMVGKNGKHQSFADGVPPNLRLGMFTAGGLGKNDGVTMAELERTRKLRVAAVPGTKHTGGYDPKTGEMFGGDARRSAKYQERVARDQEHDYFVAGEDRHGFTDLGLTEDGARQIVLDDASVAEDSKTPLDVTKDERFMNAPTEREELKYRTTRKARDLSHLEKATELEEQTNPELRRVRAIRERKAAQASAAPTHAVAKAAAARKEPAAATPTHAVAKAAAQRPIEAITDFSEAGVGRIQKGAEKAQVVAKSGDLGALARAAAWLNKQVPALSAHMAKNRNSYGEDIEKVSNQLGSADMDVANRLDSLLTGKDAPKLDRYSAEEMALTFADDMFQPDIGSDADADAFIRSSKALYDHLESARKALAAHDVDMPELAAKAHAALKDALKPNSTFDWASLYPSWEMDSGAFEARIAKALGQAAPEVAAAQSPKSQASPAKRGGVDNRAHHFTSSNQSIVPKTAQDKAVMQALANGQSARAVLRQIASTSAKPFYRQVAGMLLKSGITPTVALGHIGLGKNGAPQHGRYDRRSDTITLAASAGHAAEQIFLHEAMHAASAKALARGGLYAAQMKKLYAQVAGAVDSKDYGLKDVYEFLAEAFTNPEFQAKLKTIQVTERGVVKNAFDKLVQIVRSMLGAEVGTQDALTKALELGAKVVREDMQARQGVAGGRKLNAQSTQKDDSDVRGNHPITLAAERFRRYFDGGDTTVSAQAARRLQGVGRVDIAGDFPSFGVVGKPGAEAAFFTAGAPGSTHAFVVAPQHTAKVIELLRGQPTKAKRLDILAHYAVQHASYGLLSGEVQTFGPRPGSPAAILLQELGAVTETGQFEADGTPILRVGGVTRRQTVDFLGLLAAYTKALTGEPVLDVNWKRTTGKNPGKRGSTRVNAQHVAEHPVATDAEVQSAREYLNKVLGPQIKTEFEAITDYSGEWIEAENVVRLSTLTNAGLTNVARHEALHAFWSKFVQNNPKATKVLSSLTDDPRVLRRLQALLKDEPAALEQLADGEERLAYIYQFAMAGQLKLPHTPGTTLLHKVRKFLRRVFQMVSDQERAVDLLHAFERGDFREPDAATRVLAKTLDQGTWVTKGAKHMDGFTQRMAALSLPADTILKNSKSETARGLGKLLFTNPGDERDGGSGMGYLNARNMMMRRYDNAFRNVIGELDSRQMSELMEAMQNETPTAGLRDPDVADAKERLHGMFERFHRYLTDEKGLKIGKIKENYFPVVWDTQKLLDNKQEFKDMLLTKYASVLHSMAKGWEEERQKILASGKKKKVEAILAQRGLSETEPVTPEQVAELLFSKLTRSEGVDDEAVAAPMRMDGVLRPAMSAGEVRTLNFIKPEDRAPFLEKDLVKTVSRYVRQGVRTAEYASRFGREGEQLNEMLHKIHDELRGEAATMLKMGELKNEDAADKWVSRQYRDVANSVAGIEGSLGSDVSDWVRKANSWAVVYQNVRVLPLALFSSFVDPLGIVARGGEMKVALNTFMEGMRGVARQWGDMIREEPAQRQKGEWEKLAEAAGVIDAATFSHLLADEYGSVYLDGKTKKINETMFKANGMEAWNRAMRVGATEAAVKFIERHAQLPEKHSARWMQELGFGPGGKAVPLDSEGRLITNKHVLMDEHPTMDTLEAEAIIGQVHTALNRWVEGAILSPNAAQRPAWGSDPHYSMFWHLKQFAYSFHETLIRRASMEAKYGNYMPLGVFAWYIPTMIAADITKGLMLGAGELPGYMKGYDVGDWVLHGVDRAGVLGIGQVAVDSVQDPAYAGGPMFEQIADIFTDPIEQSIVKALPAHGVYKNAIL